MNLLKILFYLLTQFELIGNLSFYQMLIPEFFLK